MRHRAQAKQYTEAAVAEQNEMQCELLILYERKKRATAQTWLDYFLKRVDRIESNKRSKNLCHQCQA